MQIYGKNWYFNSNLLNLRIVWNLSEHIKRTKYYEKEHCCR